MKRIIPFFAFLILAAGVLAEDTRCYELRIYTAAEGKLEALNARFRDHTCALFEKHGLTNVHESTADMVVQQNTSGGFAI